jgi:hypothetical protein
MVRVPGAARWDAVEINVDPSQRGEVAKLFDIQLRPVARIDGGQVLFDHLATDLLLKRMEKSRTEITAWTIRLI